MINGKNELSTVRRKWRMPWSIEDEHVTLENMKEYGFQYKQYTFRFFALQCQNLANKYTKSLFYAIWMTIIWLRIDCWFFFVSVMYEWKNRRVHCPPYENVHIGVFIHSSRKRKKSTVNSYNLIAYHFHTKFTLFARSFRRKFFAYHYAVNHPHTNIILSWVNIPLVLKCAANILKIGLQIKIWCPKMLLHRDFA